MKDCYGFEREEGNSNEEPSAVEGSIHVMLSLIASSPTPLAHISYP